MGNSHLIESKGKWARPDQLVWGDWGLDGEPLTEQEVAALTKQFAPYTPPLDVAREFKRLKTFSTSIREMVTLKKGERGWSLRTLASISKALNEATTTPESTTTPKPKETVASATLTIDF